MKRFVNLIAIFISLSFWSNISQAQQEVEPISDARLAQLLAPVALYPDTVLTHILIASTYPLEVVQAERWSRKNDNLSAQEALDAVEDKDWDPSVKALVPFKELLTRMSEDLQWTQEIGDAFLADEERVLASIQALRNKAYEAGNLKSSDDIEVAKDKEVIVIETVRRDVVYVPYYNTRVVYGSWYWYDYPPVYWDPWYHDYHHHHHVVYWGPAVRISARFFFGAFHWHNRHVVILHDHHRHSYRHHNRRARYIASHSSSRQWRHEPKHRRGVDYRHEKVRVRYSSNQSSNRHITTRNKDHSERPIKRHQRVEQRLKEQGSRHENRHQGRPQRDVKQERGEVRREAERRVKDKKDDNRELTRDTRKERVNEPDIAPRIERHVQRREAKERSHSNERRETRERAREHRASREQYRERRAERHRARSERRRSRDDN